MKIGVTCYPTFGGSGVVATEIGLALAKRGHQVHFICYDIPRRLTHFTDNVFFHEVEVREYPLFEFQPYALSLASKMVEVSTYEELDLLHVHYAVPHATSAYLAKQIMNGKAPKIITTLHGTDITLVGQDRSYLPITRFSIIESDGVTAPSQFLRRATYDKLNIPSSKLIEVIPNFVDCERFRPKREGDKNPAAHLLGACPRQSNTKLLIHVSNFRPLKRIDDLIRAFKIVNEKVKSHLILIGDGPERSNVENLARELKIEKSVYFLGKQETFIPWLQNADLFLLPSELESFGLAALEAMSCGVPVVATSAQGIAEVVTHEESGLLSDIRDYETLAANCIRLLTNEKEIKQFGINARNRAVEHFNQESVIDSYEEYYKKILGK
jgi:N-acetyl-alpha-D-glucosaminyl L-malate synthase BshA